MLDKGAVPYKTGFMTTKQLPDYTTSRHRNLRCILPQKGSLIFTQRGSGLIPEKNMCEYMNECL